MSNQTIVLEHMYQVFLMNNKLKDTLELRTIFNAGFEAGLTFMKLTNSRSTTWKSDNMAGSIVNGTSS